MERSYEVGQHVTFIDSKSRRRDALVTAWWQAWIQPDLDKDPILDPNAGEPSCNLVVVSVDKMKEDTYGRQTEHESSVVHMSNQAAHGNYWVWPDE